MPGKWRKKKTKTTTTLPEESGQTQVTAKIDHAFASSSAAPHRSLKHLKPKLNNTWKRLGKRGRLASLIVLVGLIGFAAYMVLKPDPKPAITAGPKCSAQVLQEAAASFEPDRITYLQPVVQKIEKIPGHEQDPNCVYVELMYYINISDTNKAKELYAQLVRVYDPRAGYDPAMADKAKPPEAVKPVIDLLVKQDASYQHIGPTGAPQ